MDFNDSLTEEFVAEAKEHLDSIEDDFLTLEQQKDNPQRDLVDKVFRAIHSIKGSAGCLGYQRINELSHVMETLLSLFRSGEMKPEAAYVDALLAGCDLLNSMFDDIDNSNSFDVSRPVARLNEILQGDLPEETRKEMDTPVEVGTIFGEGLTLTIDEHTLKHIPEEHSYIYFFRYDFVQFMSNTGSSPVSVIRGLNQAGEILTAQLENQQDDLGAEVLDGPLYYDVLYSTVLEPVMVEVLCGLDQEFIRQVDRPTLQAMAASADDVSEAPQTVQATMVPEEEPAPAPVAEPASPPQDEAPPPPPPAKKPAEEADSPRESRGGGEKKSAGTIRLTVELLDELMSLAGELILARNQLLTLSDKFDPSTRAIVQRLDIVASELQETIMRTRMQPVGNVFGKMPRIVRDLSKKLGKEIDLTMTGQEVELDKTIVEALTDPLTHMIRNCCDHAIGDPQYRQSQGKPRNGTIHLLAFHEGGQINIEIQDDGRGIDPERISKKVLDKKLKTASELERMTPKEIVNLVMLPGFSTAEKISDVSGRGVGMDVVRTSIEKLGGSLELSSGVGVGTRITLRLPLTLAIIPSLIIRAGGRRYAIPQVNVEELICFYEPQEAMNRIEYAGDQEVYRLRGQLLPIVRLNEVLHRSDRFTQATKAEISRQYRITEDSNGEIVMPEIYHTNQDPHTTIKRALIFGVMNVGSRRFGLAFDDVIGTEEIVVKPMHTAVQSLHSYAGATVLGDGDVALILDMEGVGRHADAMREVADAAEDVEAKAKNQEIQPVLLFQAGPREQFAVPLAIVRRIERIDIETVECVGAREYITINDVSTLIVRLDQQLDVSPMQESTANLLLIPKHIPKPVGFLFSRVIDVKDANMELKEALLSEMGILGTGILLEKMTVFLDLFRLIEKAEPDWFADRKIELPGGNASKKVLLVEDTAFFRNLVRKYLEDEDFEVTLAEDGLQALNMMKERGDDFCMLISDLEMPQMDGWELIRQVRHSGAGWANIPSLALTSHNTDESREKAMQNGFDRFEVKIDREALLNTIINLQREMAQSRV